MRSTATRAARPAAATTSVPNRATTKRRFLVPLVRAGGFYVPSESFGGLSPERKAATAMKVRGPTPTQSNTILARSPPRTRARACSLFLSLFIISLSFSSVPPTNVVRYQKTLFTMCAVKIVLAQLEGSSAGRGGSAFGSFNPEAVQTIYKHLDEVPLKNGDEWLRGLMQKDRLLALRLVEVRESYIKEGFEWDSMQKAAIKEMESSNIEILREGAESMFK